MTWLCAQLDADELTATNLDELGGWERSGIEATAGGHVVDYLDVFDSARMLDEVTATRRIIDLYEETEFGDFARRTALEEVVRIRAVPFAHRPGYRDDWRPQ